MVAETGDERNRPTEPSSHERHPGTSAGPGAPRDPADPPGRVDHVARDRRHDLIIFVAAIVLALLPTIQLLGGHDWNPTTLLKVGRESISRPVVDRDLAPVDYVNGFGHDGQQFYVVAAALPDLPRIDGSIDRPRYRARRILLPALVLPLPNGAPKVWGMFAVTLLSIGLAAVAAAHLARRAASPDWTGIVVGLTPALVFSLQGTLADALAFTLALWGVVLWRRRLGWAVLLFTLAALARETTLVAPLACAVVGTGRQRWRLVIPFGVFAVWSAAVIAWLPLTPGARSSNIVADAADQLSWPLSGWIAVGLDSPSGLAAIALTAASIFAAVRLRDCLPEVALWLAVDAVLLVVSNTEVTFAPANLARVTPLALPAFVIALGRGRGRPAASTAKVVSRPT